MFGILYVLYEFYTQKENSPLPPQDKEQSLSLEFDKLNQLQLEWEGPRITKLEEMPSKIKVKSVRKWTKLKNGLFGWRVIRQSKQDKGEPSSLKTTPSNFKWQPKLEFVEKGVIEEKLGNTIQNKRKQPMSVNYKNSGDHNLDNDTDLDRIKKRKCPVGT